MKQKHYFEGLNALRFFAAALVVFYHIRINLFRLDLGELLNFAIFLKGDEAVFFFFTLSGFLITYLLLEEKHRTEEIDVKKFYMRRILRIWPLYYIIVIVGLMTIYLVYPIVGIDYGGNKFNLIFGIGAYVFFLPNLIYGLYNISGIIGVTWSIGVEEQYYLFWAPLVKKYFKNILELLLIVLIITSGLSIANSYNAFDLSAGWQKFVGTLHFNYMAVGGLAAYLFYYNKSALLNLKIFSSRIGQIFMFLFLLYFFFFYNTIIPVYLVVFILPVLFAWLILNVSENREHRIFALNSKVLNYLGKISYGIYMYHYLCVFLITYLFAKFQLQNMNTVLFLILYIGSIWFLTIAVSHFSFNYIEKSFLKLKHKWE